MLKAIVFDFDGVIVDSEPLHYHALRDVGREIGYELDSDDYMRRFIGFDDRDAFRQMLFDLGKPVEDEAIAPLVAKKQAVFEALAEQGVVMIPGSRALIEELHAQQFPMAIASGATMADIDQVLRGVGLRDCFEVIITANHVVASKPHPETYALAARELAVKHEDLAIEPAHCLAIEDTAAGIASARGAGLQTLALETTGRREELLDAGRVIPNLDGVTLAQLRAWYE